MPGDPPLFLASESVPIQGHTTHMLLKRQQAARRTRLQPLHAPATVQLVSVSASVPTAYVPIGETQCSQTHETP
jgi:hypothetical protein